MNYLKLLLIASSISLSGCVAPYVPPSGIPMSTVNVINRMGTTAATYLYEGAQACTERRGVGKIEPWGTKLVEVAADKRLAFLYVNTTKVVGYPVPMAVYPCMFTLDFVPQPGRTYTLRVEQDAGLNSCIYSLTEGGKQVLHKERIFIAAHTEAGPFCPAD
ncbi:hypothetical protein Hsc_3375 [Herbaspirillum seropedicae]|nr:hypothetical protein Hsc_3375 [Herbaspirillum seropedicae]